MALGIRGCIPHASSVEAGVYESSTCAEGCPVEAPSLFASGPYPSPPPSNKSGSTGEGAERPAPPPVRMLLRTGALKWASHRPGGGQRGVTICGCLGFLDTDCTDNTDSH
jgi:hypothetical protein